MSTSPKQSTQKKSACLVGILLLLILGSVCLVFYLDSKGNIQVINFHTLSGPLLNPLMGWAPWATIEQSHQPHTLVYADLTWRDFEPQEGFYDFATFEKKQQLARWRQEGKRVVFRFVLDIPGKETHLDIPDWLFEKINGDGDYYDNQYGKGFSPNYSNPVLIAYHKETIRALGERYGKDGFFAFIELGSLGHWGEWHTYPGIWPLPSESIRNLYVSHYMEAFPGTHLLMRRPFSIAQKLGLGLYNDMTADPVQTDIWLDWIENGGKDLPQEPSELSPMPDDWQKVPIGGEQAPNLSNEEVYGTNLEQTVRLLKRSHTTFIGPGGPYGVENGDPLQAGLDHVMSIIGYRIYLDRVQMPRRVTYGKSMNIDLTFSNDGIAPMYYNWPARLYLWDEKGNIIATYQPQIDFRMVLPNKFYTTVFKMPVGDLKNGRYSIGIAILDPITGQPAVTFANENTRSDMIQSIGSFEVKGILYRH